ncbi:MAG: methyltransferase domain-containing protein, partial [Candidatus Sericytochromatia bacterium]
KGCKVLDVGCWTGGDALILAGLGANVLALEEHPVSARAAAELCARVGAAVEVRQTSLYHDRQDWKQSFDFIYCAGVVYHVTDPLLLLRILFAYLKPGGSVLIETKSAQGEGSICTYSGLAERGWNFYAPNEPALARWLLDTGYEQIRLIRRGNGRLLAAGVKTAPRPLPEPAGFSRPGSWLEQEC